MNNQSMKQGKRVWIYCRMGHDDGLTLDCQIENLTAFARQQGLDIVGVTSEPGSGLDYDRTELKEVMLAAENKQADIVLAKDVSRIGRDMADTILYLHELRQHGIIFATLNDSGSEIKPWAFPTCIPEYVLEKSKRVGLVQKN